ncbi:hypothetical protein Drorol1_Dr00019329 [Drosera rotundifolia]
MDQENGGSGWKDWDEGRFDGIKEIHIRYEGCVDSLSKRGMSCVEKSMAGSEVVSKRRVSDSFHLPFCLLCGHLVVRTIRLESSRRSFGPYGEVQGTRFCFPVDGGKIVGF